MNTRDTLEYTNRINELVYISEHKELSDLVEAKPTKDELFDNRVRLLWTAMCRDTDEILCWLDINGCDITKNPSKLLRVAGIYGLMLGVKYVTKKNIDNDEFVNDIPATIAMVSCYRKYEVVAFLDVAYESARPC